MAECVSLADAQPVARGEPGISWPARHCKLLASAAAVENSAASRELPGKLPLQRRARAKEEARSNDNLNKHISRSQRGLPPKLVSRTPS